MCLISDFENDDLPKKVVTDYMEEKCVNLNLELRSGYFQ